MFGHVKGLQNDTNKRESDQVNESEERDSEKDDISYPKKRESLGMMMLSQETEGMELNLKREKMTKGIELIPTKEKVTKRTKLILKFPSIKLGHLSLRKWIISGVQGSYTGVVLTRHHSSILCILLN